MRFAAALALELKAQTRTRIASDSERSGWSAADQAWYDRQMAKDAPRLRRYNRRNGKQKKPRNQGPMTIEASPREAFTQRQIEDYQRHRRAPEPRPAPRPLNMSTPARKRRAAAAAAQAAANQPLYGRTMRPQDLRSRTPEAPTRARPKKTFRELTVQPFPRDAEPGTRAFRMGTVPRQNLPSARAGDGDPRVRPSYVRRRPGGPKLGPRFTPLNPDPRTVPQMGADGIIRLPWSQPTRRPRRRAKSFTDMLDLELKALGL